MPDHPLASEFIAQNELPPLLDGAGTDAVRILPLITNECSYKGTKLNRYQTFNDPDEPLEGMDRARQNRLLRQFAGDLRRVQQNADGVKSAERGALA
jgi:hypothetical protein